MVISVRNIPLFASVSLRNGGDASNAALFPRFVSELPSHSIDSRGIVSRVSES